MSVKIKNSWVELPIENILAPNEKGVILGQGWSPQCEKIPSQSERDWGVLKTTAIQSGYFLEEENKLLPSHLEPRTQHEVKSGDILITCAGPRNRCGVACLVRKTRKRLLISGKMYRFRVNDKKAIPEFVELFLLSQKAWKEIDKMKTGGSDSGLNLTHTRFKTLIIPIPPLPEQQAIVSKIEELFSDLDNGIQQLQKAQQQLKIYRQSLLNTIVTEINCKSIESVICKLDQGWSPKCLNEHSRRDNEWAVIKTTAVQHGNFNPNENKILPLNLNPREQHELKVGDILITRAGPRIRVGVCCMVKKTRPRLINCDKVYRIKVNTKIIGPEYFELILNTPYYQREIEKMKSGISDSGLNLTQSKFLKIEIPIPSLAEQKLIVDELESKLTVCDKIEETITQSLQQAESLRQSILKKAFEGKLV